MSSSEHIEQPEQPNLLPLKGVRVLALEQYIATPLVTQILSRLGAEVVKIEPISRGEAGRNGLPSTKDRQGRPAGSTFFRNNLGKKSIALDLKSDKAIELLLSLIPQFDVFCENLGPGKVESMGLSYGAVSKLAPKMIYLSITGFGKNGDSPYSKRPAFASIAEAMAGAYDFAQLSDRPPIISPMGPLGDTATALFGVIGVLAAIRCRDIEGVGQFVDMAMYDTMLSLCDYIPNYWSMGLRKEPNIELKHPGILSGYRAADGWFVLHIIRRHQFERLAKIINKPEWLADERLDTPYDWAHSNEKLVRPAIESWAASMNKHVAAETFAEAGIPSAPCNTADDLITDEHIAKRNMLIEVPQLDHEPIFIGGNPIKMSRLKDEVSTEFPLLGEHTEAVLKQYLHLTDAQLEELKATGVIG